MNKNIIGYQIQVFDKDIGQYKNLKIDNKIWVLFKTREDAELYTQYNIKEPFYQIIEIVSNHPNDYVYFDDCLKNNFEFWFKIISQRLTKNPHIKIRYLNKHEGEIVFKGIVRESFFERIKTIIKATDVYVTYCRTQFVDGIIIGFKFY